MGIRRNGSTAGTVQCIYNIHTHPSHTYTYIYTHPSHTYTHIYIYNTNSFVPVGVAMMRPSACTVVTNCPLQKQSSEARYGLEPLGGVGSEVYGWMDERLGKCMCIYICVDGWLGGGGKG